MPGHGQPAPLSRIVKSATLVAHGASHRAAGAQLGISHHSVQADLKTDVGQAIIAKITADTIRDAATAAANLRYAIQAYQPANRRGAKCAESAQSSPIIADAQLREHGYKASVEVLRAVGVLTSHSQSVTINNILNQSNNLHLDSGVGTYLSYLGLSTEVGEEVDFEAQSGADENYDE